MAKAKRSEVLQIRLTKGEIAQVRKAAAGIPLSTFARFRLLGAALTVPATTTAAFASEAVPAAKNRPSGPIPCKLCGAETGHKLACPARTPAQSSSRLCALPLRHSTAVRQTTARNATASTTTPKRAAASPPSAWRGAVCGRHRRTVPAALATTSATAASQAPPHDPPR